VRVVGRAVGAPEPTAPALEHHLVASSELGRSTHGFRCRSTATRRQMRGRGRGRFVKALVASLCTPPDLDELTRRAGLDHPEGQLGAGIVFAAPGGAIEQGAPTCTSGTAVPRLKFRLPLESPCM
jgi:hypothetical protein